MYILKTRIDNLNKQEIPERVEIFLSEEKFHQIATVNPEFILEARGNEEFRNILNQCDLNIADGMGIKFAFWRKGERLKSRIAGADLMDEILKIADEKNLGVFLIVNNKGLSSWEETRDAIFKKYPNLKISGVNLDKNIHQWSMVNGQWSIVFCNFGAPYQEKFLHSLKSLKNANIKLAMGVGGGFDFITGKVKRAPSFMRKLGLEWLWRLIQQPKRIKRIWNAVIIFPIKIIFSAQGGPASGGNNH